MEVFPTTDKLSIPILATHCPLAYSCGNLNAIEKLVDRSVQISPFAQKRLSRFFRLHRSGLRCEDGLEIRLKREPTGTCLPLLTAPDFPTSHHLPPTTRFLHIRSQNFRYAPRLGNAASRMVRRVAVEHF